jgi:DNA-binding transcriptional regulator LsrR (DeoR family)
MGDNESLLTEIAKMYYEHNLSQKEISKRLGLSGPTMSRLLRKARDTGIVEVKIRPLEIKVDECAKLTEILCSNLKLRGVFVVPQSSNGEYVRKNMGKKGAEWLGKNIKRNMILGLAGGRSVASIVEHIGKNLDPIEIVPLMGGINSLNNSIHSDMVVWNISKKLGAVSHIIHSPAILADKNDVHNIRKNPVVSRVLSLFDRIDLAIVGIGTMQEDSPLMQSDLLNSDDISFLKNEAFIGEICGRFFNKNGEELIDHFAERTISITLKQLSKIPLVCIIASGLEKVECIKIAAKAGFFNVLITDEKTARAIISR